MWVAIREKKHGEDTKGYFIDSLRKDLGRPDRKTVAEAKAAAAAAKKGEGTASADADKSTSPFSGKTALPPIGEGACKPERPGAKTSKDAAAPISFGGFGGFSFFDGYAKYTQPPAAEYTVMMDVWLEQLPDQDLSLFTPDAETEEIDAGCQLNKSGGIGLFGQYGTKSAAVDAQKWRRLVIVVKLGGKGEEAITTYVCGRNGTVKCATVTQEALAVRDGPFALSAEKMRLFYSPNKALQLSAGTLKLKYVSVARKAFTQEEVHERAAQDRIFSYWAEEQEELRERRAKAMVLHGLYKRPGPLFVYPPFLAEFGESFIEGTGLEGGDLPTCVPIFSLVFERMLELEVTTSLLNECGMKHRVWQALSGVSRLLQDAAFLSGKFKMALRGGADLVKFVTKLRTETNKLAVGESMLIPGAVCGASLIYILERVAADLFRFVVINTDPDAGLMFHQASAEAVPAIQYKVCMVFKNIPKAKVVDDGWWLLLMKLCSDPNASPTKLYDLLLPWLVESPLEEALVDDDGPNCSTGCSFRDPQTSAVSWYKALQEAVHYLLRTRGLSAGEARQVAFAVRTAMLELARADLAHLPGIDDSGYRILKLAWEQYAFLAAALAEDQLLSADQLEAVKRRIDGGSDGIKNVVLSMSYTNERTDGPPPPLELDEGTGVFGLRELLGSVLTNRVGDGIALESLLGNDVIGVRCAAVADLSWESVLLHALLEYALHHCRGGLLRALRFRRGDLNLQPRLTFSGIF